MIDKVKVWASLSKGCFPIQKRPTATELAARKGSDGACKAVAGNDEMEKTYFARFSCIQDEDQVRLPSHADALNDNDYHCTQLST